MGVLMSTEFKKATAGAFDRENLVVRVDEPRPAKRRRSSLSELFDRLPRNAAGQVLDSPLQREYRARKKEQLARERETEKKAKRKAAPRGKKASLAKQVKSEETRDEDEDEIESRAKVEADGEKQEEQQIENVAKETRSSKRKRESLAATTDQVKPLASPLLLVQEASKPASEVKTQHPVYTYSAAAESGVTHLYTSREQPTKYRHIRSEYTLPVLKLACNTPPPPPPSERVSSTYFRPEPVVLIQNSIAHSLYALLVQAILWNQTTGKMARPVLDELLRRYPDPKTLAEVEQEELAELLQPIGLYNSRAKRLRDLASIWVEKPPLPGRGYTRTRDRKYTDVPIVVSFSENDTVDEYDDEGGDEDAEGEEIDEDDEDFQHNGAVSYSPQNTNNKAAAGSGTTSQSTSVKPELSDEILETAREQSDPGFWEIAHLPGVGPYALDSFRIFHRDEMRGLADDWLGTGAEDPEFEPEWRRVVPSDKDLRLYLKYLWEQDGWDWDPLTGKKKKKIQERPKRESKGGKKAK